MAAAGTTVVSDDGSPAPSAETLMVGVYESRSPSSSSDRPGGQPEAPPGPRDAPGGTSARAASAAAAAGLRTASAKPAIDTSPSSSTRLASARVSVQAAERSTGENAACWSCSSSRT